MEQHYITVLDFTDSRVYQYKLTESFDKTTLAHWQNEDFEEFIVSKGHKLNSIEWMAHESGEIITN